MNTSEILGNIITLQRGYDLPSKNRVSGEYPIISSSGFSGTHNEFKVQGENVITGRYGTIGKVYYYSGKCWPLNTSLFVKNFHGNDARYAYYLLEYALKTLKIDGKDKSTVPGVDRNVLHQIKIPFISSLEKQKSTVEILQLIDKKIQNNIEINDNLVKQLSKIFDYWFTQFDFPNVEGRPFSQTGGDFKESASYSKKIPSSWKDTQISEIMDIRSGFPFSSDSYESNGIYKLITIKNVQNDGINLNVDNYINVIPENVPNYCKLKIGDLLMSLTGNVGRVGWMYAENCLLNQRVAIIIPKSDYLKTYAYCLFKSDYIKQIMQNLAGGSSQVNLSPIDVAKIVIPYDEAIAKQFENYTNPLKQQIVSNLIENSELSTIRDWLLPMLMNGQLTTVE